MSHDVQYAKFVPLFDDIQNVFNEIIEIEQAAEHNKRICCALKQRVYIAVLTVLDLKVQRNQDFFNGKNFLNLQTLITVINQIKNFVTDISQMKSLLKIKYIQTRNIEQMFKDLCRDFDACMQSIDLALFTNMIKDKINPDEETKQLKADQEELDNYIAKMLEELVTDAKEVKDDVKEAKDDGKEVKGDVKEVKDDVKEVKDDVKEVKDDVKEVFGEVGNSVRELTSMVLKVNTMNIMLDKILVEQTKSAKSNKSEFQTRIDDIFQVGLLKLSDYKETSKEPRKGGRVTKWVNVKNNAEEFAFKTIVSDIVERDGIKNQVAILRELHNCQNIIRFYGIVYDGNKYHLVTEWAEYGNLREFYTNKDFDLKLKLRMSLDVARGLNFLRALEIVHRDIRAENILITRNDTAKLSDFKLSRTLHEATLRQVANVERIRYCAPELLDRDRDQKDRDRRVRNQRVQKDLDLKYDHKCEVYSFGILLWEIAEEKVPYNIYGGDIVKITELVRDEMYRESFSENSQMPQEFRDLAVKAVNHDPNRRPKVTTMFEVLHKCFECFECEYNKKPSQKHTSLDLDSSQVQNQAPPQMNQGEIPDFESFKYMTLADAAKQHRLIAGDTKTAYKCFEAYANLSQTSAIRNQIKAKFYKAVYLLKGLDNTNMNDEEKDRTAASLFKEVADSEIEESPEAACRYGDYLYNGKGVERNLPKALEYFEKAANSGLKVAMHNAGKLYFNGNDGIEKDERKALTYLQLAVYNEYDPAIKFCKERNINIQFADPKIGAIMCSNQQ